MKFRSQFLDPNLKDLVDRVTLDTLEEIKKILVAAMREGGKFKGEKDIQAIQSAHTPRRLQQIYYYYILAAENKKTIK